MDDAGTVIAGQTLDLVEGTGDSIADGDGVVVQTYSAKAVIADATNIVNYTLADVADAAALEVSLETEANQIEDGNLAVNDGLFFQYETTAGQVRLAVVQVTIDGGTHITGVEVADVAILGNIADLAAASYDFV